MRITSINTCLRAADLRSVNPLEWGKPLTKTRSEPTTDHTNHTWILGFHLMQTLLRKETSRMENDPLRVL